MEGGILGLFNAGGPIMYVLGGLSLISLGIICAKVVQLAGAASGAARRDTALTSWQAGEKQAAFDAARIGKTPADRVLAYAMESLDQGLGGPRLDEDLTRRGGEELARMSSGIRALELIAMVSPLIGLLGTVLGMIQSFQGLALAEGAANASVLAGGIWVALLTTAAGLLVAIPAAIGAGLLSGRIERATLQIEGAVGRLMMIEEAATRGTHK